MNFKLIYISPNGTTRRTSEVLRNAMEKDGHSVELLDIGSQAYRKNFPAILENCKEADIVGFGSPAYHMDMLEPIRRLFMKMMTSSDTYCFKSFMYLNYSGITSGKAFINTAHLFETMQIPVIGAMKIAAPHFHHKEIFPTESTEVYIQRFYYEMQEKEFAPIPWKSLYKMVSPNKKRVNLLYPLAHLIGKKRELKINIRQEKCIKCGMCEKECPVGAISLHDFACIDFAKCIHCYHCVTACKGNAVEACIGKIDDLIKMNKRIIGIENPQNHMYI